jgi:hypothetical protein
MRRRHGAQRRKQLPLSVRLSVPSGVPRKIVKGLRGKLRRRG